MFVGSVDGLEVVGSLLGSEKRDVDTGIREVLRHCRGFEADCYKNWTRSDQGAWDGDQLSAGSKVQYPAVEPAASVVKVPPNFGGNFRPFDRSGYEWQSDSGLRWS